MLRPWSILGNVRYRVRIAFINKFVYGTCLAIDVRLLFMAIEIQIRTLHSSYGCDVQIWIYSSAQFAKNDFRWEKMLIDFKRKDLADLCVNQIFCTSEKPNIFTNLKNIANFSMADSYSLFRGKCTINSWTPNTDQIKSRPYMRRPGNLSALLSRERGISDIFWRNHKYSGNQWKATQQQAVIWRERMKLPD